MRMDVPMSTSCGLQSVNAIAELDISSSDHDEPCRIRISARSCSLRVMEACSIELKPGSPSYVVLSAADGGVPPQCCPLYRCSTYTRVESPQQVKERR